MFRRYVWVDVREAILNAVKHWAQSHHFIPPAEREEVPPGVGVIIDLTAEARIELFVLPQPRLAALIEEREVPGLGIESLQSWVQFLKVKTLVGVLTGTVSFLGANELKVVLKKKIELKKAFLLL